MKKNLLFIAMLFISITLNAQYWSQQNTNMTGATPVGVDVISIVDSNIVWVNGFNGSGAGRFIQSHARTNDGGATWTAANYSGFGVNVQATVLSGVTYDKAFCVAYDTAAGAASFWGTTDGSTWALVTGVMNTGTTTFADGVKFWDGSKGFCYGDPVSSNWDIYTTSDGGTTWNDVPNGSMPAPLSTSEYGYNGADCASIVAGGFACFLTNSGRVVKSSDYGVTWTATTTAPFASIPSSGKIYASSPNRMIISSYISASTSWDWRYTTDGGVTWDTLTPTGPFYEYGMCYVPGSFDMLVATSPDLTNGAGVAYSNDGGLSWTDYTDALLQPASANIQCLAVGYYNMNIGWVGNYDQASLVNSILKYNNPNGGAGVQTYTLDQNDFNIYPNPSSGNVNFSVNGPNTEDIHVKVFDLAGNIIFGTTLNVNGVSNSSYDFSLLSKGIYIVNVSSVSEKMNKKLIIN
jgi:hypothetical protein